jgi:hypothetical protein
MTQKQALKMIIYSSYLDEKVKYYKTAISLPVYIFKGMLINSTRIHSFGGIHK